MLSVTETRFELDASALIASWPPADRARVPGASLRVIVPARDEPGYLVSELADGFERWIAIERERAGAAITPSAFALRIAPNVPWRRVLAAIYSATSRGFTEPRFVLREGDREVYLAVPIPRTSDDPHASIEVARALEQLLAEVGEDQGRPGLERPASPLGPAADVGAGTAEIGASEPSMPNTAPTDSDAQRIAETGARAPNADRSAPLHLILTDRRTVRVEIGPRPLAPGCGSVHDAPIDVLLVIDPEGIARCLEAARGAGPSISGARLSADGAIPYEQIAPALEQLRARSDTVTLLVPM